MITERQEKLLGFLIKEYINSSEPMGSLALKKAGDLDVSAATIRNDLQELTKQGYIKQPHTSAGRVPTKKAYKHFAEKIAEESFGAAQDKQLEDFIMRQVRFAHEEMEREMKFMEDLMQTLENDNIFEILNILDAWHKRLR